MEYLFNSLMISLVWAAILGIIPGIIAYKKGYSFVGWWFYGWMLFIVAIVHVILIPDKNAKQPAETPAPNSVPYQSVADELKKYKELMDQGVISEEEFQAKKAELLKLV